MKHTYKRLVFTILLGGLATAPLMAKSLLLHSLDGLFEVLLAIAVVGFVLLLIPIITAIVGVKKNNQKLIVFSKIYSFVALGLVVVNAVYNDLKPWLFHLIIFLIAALPLVILEARKKQN
ncbi:hypothetical protein [Microscilla marina]|uniref:Uncharacterized protein n=1 Tax=Microscilla marina ATCC 23134 TaxID=313606 RepID=A1ZQ59_MICM2|nr:hypothetical protein [Microscilla marina]EAY27468.1 hypothetical protein M23134_06869 [Microscilla marina ATCC 23134]